MGIKIVDEIKQKYLDNMDEEIMETLENYLDDCSCLLYVNLKKKTIHPIIRAEQSSPELDEAFKNGYEKYTEFFIKNFILASDRAWFEEKTSLKYIKEQLTKAPHFSFIFNYVYHGEVRRELLNISRYGHCNDRILICGQSVNPGLIYEADYMRNYYDEKRKAVIYNMSSHYELVAYMENEFQTMTVYHISERLRALCEGADLSSALLAFEIIKRNVVSDELTSFIEKANRKTFWEHISNDMVYSVNFNMVLDGKTIPCIMQYNKDENNEVGVVISLQALN